MESSLISLQLIWSIENYYSHNTKYIICNRCILSNMLYLCTIHYPCPKQMLSLDTQ